MRNSGCQAKEMMTSNDGDDTRTHHEGGKRESAKRKGGRLVMRRKRGEGAAAAEQQKRREGLRKREMKGWIDGDPGGRAGGAGELHSRYDWLGSRGLAAGAPVAGKGRAGSRPP